jgi:hypothetical protein
MSEPIDQGLHCYVLPNDDPDYSAAALSVLRSGAELERDPF